MYYNLYESVSPGQEFALIYVFILVQELVEIKPKQAIFVFHLSLILLGKLPSHPDTTTLQYNRLHPELLKVTDMQTCRYVPLQFFFEELAENVYF